MRAPPIPLDARPLPIWSPEGSRLVFRSNRSGPFDLYEKPSSGGGTDQRLFASAQLKTPVDWSADGRFLLYQLVGGKTGYDLWALPLTGDRKPFPIAQSPFERRQHRAQSPQTACH